MREREWVVTGEPVVTNAEELREALALAFLMNADSGRDDANDEFVAALLAWRRRNEEKCA